MAPTRSSRSHKALPNHSSSTRSTHRPRSFDDPYAVPHQQNKAPTKARKRFVKHATLLSRLLRTVSSSKVTKRRRPSKKLVTGLEDLEDALPDTATGAKRSQDQNQPDGRNKPKTLKSRPGALKKKEKLLTAERDRFAKNLALMARRSNDSIENAMGLGVNNTKNPDEIAMNESSSGSGARWAAIRAHVERTMETVDHRNSSS